MRYVYLLQSEAVADQRYVSITSDLRIGRSAQHWKIAAHVQIRAMAESCIIDTESRYRLRTTRNAVAMPLLLADLRHRLVRSTFAQSSQFASRQV